MITSDSYACTTFSAIAHNGQVWNANNEDGPKGIANFINFFPKIATDTYGYYTLSYMSPAYGTGGSIQGGMNEAGLTFDFDAIDWVENFDPASKKPYPEGNDAILPHILGNMSTVQEVIEFFNVYWFDNGFRSAQMHVADSTGRFAIISASGIQLVEKGQYLVSTNFDICGQEDGSSCWRFPIASQHLNESTINLETMINICKATAQKTGGTMYSNVQNLSTGEVWLFSQHDPGVLVHFDIDSVLAQGPNSYSFNDLQSIVEPRTEASWTEPNVIDLTDDKLNEVLGTYSNYYIGNIVVKKADNGIVASFEDGMSIPFSPSSENTFYLPNQPVMVKFELDKKNDQLALKLYEDNFWSFTAWKKSE
ncbi:MAG: hypothetical protein CMP48_13095 [Rickettsiales bacterium]|nr:hypothetical protein [Rickettsiales bacterium]